MEFNHSIMTLLSMILAVFEHVNGLLICTVLPSLVIEVILNFSVIVIFYFVLYMIFILIEVVEWDPERFLIFKWATELLSLGMAEVKISKGKICYFAFVRAEVWKVETRRPLLSCIVFCRRVISLRVDRSVIISCFVVMQSRMLGWMTAKGHYSFRFVILITVGWLCFR